MFDEEIGDLIDLGDREDYKGKVNMSLQKASHGRYGHCYKLWFRGNPEPILIQIVKGEPTWIGEVPNDFQDFTEKEKKFIKWCVDRYNHKTGQQEIKLDEIFGEPFNNQF